MPQKCKKKREMIIVDERDPVGELPPPFPPRNVVVKDDDDVRKFYDLKREIGRGRFGTVYLVHDKETGQKFAAKFVNTKRNQDRANVEREIEIMKALNAERAHPKLIQLYDAFDMNKEMCLVLEIVAGGELFERVIDDDFVLTEKACAIFVRQICEGVEFIHSKNILHLDMKPENILCLSREGNRIKICDFGLARKYDPRKKLQVLFGTPEFVAPEVVNFEPISFGTDMWSVGVITYVLLSGLSPFMGHNYVETMTNVTKNKYDFEDEAFKSVSEDAKDFIRRLLVLDKSLRLTPAQCQHHCWLKQPPSNTLRRSLILSGSVSDSESEEESDEEVDDEDVSIEEKIMKEEQENEKDRKRKEEELAIEAEAKKKALEQQAEIKRKELERQVEEEAKKIELEKLSEAEAARERELDKLAEAEAKKRELEKLAEAEAKRKELEILAETQKRKEELELTKKQLKDFVERWNSHPNSPYLIGTPLVLDFQRVARSGGWTSRDSFASVVVGPPSDPGDISEPEDLDAVDQDEFIRYTIEPQRPTITKQLSPEEVAKELGEKLTQLQQEELNKNRENDEKTSAEVELKNRANKNMSIIENAEITLNNNKKQEKEEVSETVNDLENKLIKSAEKDRTKTTMESKKETPTAPKESKESKMERHKRAYEERKKLKNVEDEKKKKTPVLSEEQKQLAEIRKQNELIQNEEKDSAMETLKKIKEKPLSDYKKEYEEYLKLVNEPPKKKEEVQSSPTPKRSTNLKTGEAKIPSRKINGIEKSASLSVVKDLQKKGDKAGKAGHERNLSTGFKKPFSQRFRLGKENSIDSATAKQNQNQFPDESGPVCMKSRETEIAEHKKLYQEYLQMMGETKDQEFEVNKIGKEDNVNAINNNNFLDQRLQKDKENVLSENSRELQRKVSDSYKAIETQRKSSAKTIENLPKEPLKRPEIIALQNEELGGSLPRQRKKSTTRFEIGGEYLSIDHSSRGSTPGSPGLEGSPSPKFERKAIFDDSSRGATPTKQLKKQTSRDVPLSPKDEIPGASPRQRKPSRDVPLYYSSFDDDDRQPSSDLTPEGTPTLSRKTSRDERPSSRGTREGTPLNRRPSRDVPLTQCQLERLSASNAAAIEAEQGAESQAWPDLIVAPQGEDVDECGSFKDSLDVPVATLVKSPSGTLLSVPEVTISHDERKRNVTPPPLSPTTNQEINDESDPSYVSNNKLVAWILDIGNVQNQQNVPCTTSDRVTKWESRDSSPRPTGRSSRDTSPRPRDRSPLPTTRCRDKSPIPSKQPTSRYPLSREPSALSLKSSESSDNLYIHTPWGTMKRSPSRTNLSQSPSFEIPVITLKESQDRARNTTEDLSQYSQSDDHMSVDSSTRSPSPKMMNNIFQKQDSLEISEIRDFQSSSRLSGELPPKPSDKNKTQYRSNKEENLNLSDESKSHTLPRSSRLMKMNSVSSMKPLANDRKVDNKKSLPPDSKSTDTSNSDGLKRKSKFPSSPNQKKKLGPLLFSAQDRISQFEQTKPPTRTQRPITRTKSNMVFSKTSEKLSSHNIMENSLICDENKNAKPSLLSSKSNDKTHVKFLTTKLLDKVGKSPGGPPGDVIQNVDSVNNNNVGNARRNSIIFNRRDSSRMTKL